MKVIKNIVGLIMVILTQNKNTRFECFFMVRLKGLEPPRR